MANPGTVMEMGIVLPGFADAYSPGRAYTFYEQVLYDGDTYAAKGPTTGNPPTDENFWFRMTKVRPVVEAAEQALSSMQTLSEQVETQEEGRQTAETKRQEDTGTAIQATNNAAAKALEDGQTAIGLAQGAVEGIKADINATILDTAAPRLLQRAHGNPVAINPAAGSRMTVEADKGCTVWLHGKNRWAKNTSKVVNGVTMSVASDGTVTLNGTATSAAAFRINLIMPLPGGVYTLSANNPAFGDASASSNSVRLSVGATGQSETAFNMLYLAEKNASKVTTLTGVGYMQIVVSAGTTVSELTFKPQLEAGDTATPYEPCADSTLSLTANTPTEIQAIPGTNHLYADNGVWLQVAYSPDSMAWVDKTTVPVSAEGPVARLDHCEEGLPLDVVLRCVATGGGGTQEEPKPIVGKQAVNLTVYGATEADHKHTYPITLPEPVYGLPDAPDEVWVDRDGRVWWTKREHVYVVTGNENWTKSSTTAPTGEIRYDCSVTNVPKPINTYTVQSSHYTYHSVNAPGIWHSGVEIDNRIEIRIMGNYATVDDLKAYLAAQLTANTPVQIGYQLATPITTQIGQLTLPATDPVTVYSDAGGDTTITGRMGVRGLFARIQALEDTVTKH